MPVSHLVHCFWGGPHKPPLLWIGTWVKFCQKYGWTHRLWTDKDVEAFGLVNKAFYDKERSWQGKSDIFRYELLERLGGMYVDCDALWLGGDLISAFGLDKHDMVLAFEPTTKFIPPRFKGRLFANGFIACAPHHPLMKAMVEQMAVNSNMDPNIEAFARTGPCVLTDMINRGHYQVHTVPTNQVFPVDFHYSQARFDPFKFSANAQIFVYCGLDYAIGRGEQPTGTLGPEHVGQPFWRTLGIVLGSVAGVGLVILLVWLGHRFYKGHQRPL